MTSSTNCLRAIAKDADESLTPNFGGLECLAVIIPLFIGVVCELCGCLGIFMLAFTGDEA